MALHYACDGYTFRADAQSLVIEPGPKPITLTRPELDQLGLDIRDDHKIPWPTLPSTQSQPSTLSSLH